MKIVYNGHCLLNHFSIQVTIELCNNSKDESNIKFCPERRFTRNVGNTAIFVWKKAPCVAELCSSSINASMMEERLEDDIHTDRPTTVRTRIEISWV